LATLTPKQLHEIMPRCPADKTATYARALTSAMMEAQINTVMRAAAFLGQLALESGELRYMEEKADGAAYEGRVSLGNTEPGDGPRYKGRGPIQLTGRKNYQAAGAVLGLDLVQHPEMAAEPDVGFRVAAWYWSSRRLNVEADTLDYRAVTKAINGASTDGAPSHYLRRLEYYRRALEILGRDTAVF
jgi:putative chitinase